jgi:Pyruvate/2-oxoacid:ferredoxin oxidoreductase delta subunit
VLELIESCGDAPVATIHCFCRYWRKTVGDPCRFKMPDEACIIVGDEARHFIKYGFGRAITKDEALSIIAAAQKGGAIHTLFHQRDEADRPVVGICNCCWDCCGLWGGYNRGIGPLFLKCFYEARISDPAACRGCQMCEKHCPTAAVVVKGGKGGRSEINGALCIGCGQCAYQCNHGTISLDYREREIHLPLQKPSKARIRI